MELKSKGLSVDFTVYDGPAGRSLCILIKDHTIYDKALKQFKLEAAWQQGLLLWIRALYAA
jgi:hypothetical protein